MHSGECLYLSVSLWFWQLLFRLLFCGWNHFSDPSILEKTRRGDRSGEKKTKRKTVFGWRGELTGRSGWGFIKRQWHWLIRNIRPWCAELCRAYRPPGRSERASESIKQMPGGWRVLTLTGRQAHMAAHYNGIYTLAGGGGGHLE